jgi:hypothetical protein
VRVQWDDEVRFVLHAELDFYSASSLKQQSAPLWHIILIPSQPVFALSPQCCVLSGEATNTNTHVLAKGKQFLNTGIDEAMNPTGTVYVA